MRPKFVRPTTKLPHPQTGNITSVWGHRRAAILLGTTRERLDRLVAAGVIPEALYQRPDKPVSPLYSGRQIRLLASLIRRIERAQEQPDAMNVRIAKGTAAKIRNHWNDPEEGTGRNYYKLPGWL